LAKAENRKTGRLKNTELIVNLQFLKIILTL
jgi:hypothetical protein